MSSAATNVVQVAAAQWGADTLTIATADQVQQIAGGDPLRRELTIFTDPDSAGVLWLVPNTGQRRGGIRLVAGAGYTFHHGAPVYGYSTGGDVLVNVVSETGSVC